MKQTLLSLLSKPSATHYLLLAFLVLAFLGFLDSTYLTILHYKNSFPPCSFAHGCETVLTSRYATFFGIPIALLGSGFYLVIMALVGVLLQNPVSTDRHGLSGLAMTKNIPSFLLLLTTLGLFTAIFLVYLQAFVIHAFCQYCLASEMIDFLLFDCSWWLWRKH